MEVPLPLLLLGAWLLTPACAVHPGCECLLFTGTFGKPFGTFSSPDYPRPYPPGVGCLLYTFLAAQGEIVELTFRDFDVHKAHLDCARGDFVKLFLHLERADVNEFTPWSALLCGGLGDVPRRLYSSGPGLVLEFHSERRAGSGGGGGGGGRASNASGFLGRFRFIDTRLFQTDGQRVAGSSCDHVFVSGDGAPRHGRFFSPRFPASYPPSTRCAYRFQGRAHERVRVVFEEVSLEQGDMSCLTRADVVWVRDGRGPSAPALATLCGSGGGARDLLSSGPDLFVEFVANSAWPGQGFKASFQFQPAEPGGAHPQHGSPAVLPAGTGRARAPTHPLPPPPTRDADGAVEGDEPSVSATTASCDRVLSSDAAKRGIVASPGFPGAYPARARCRYDFQGKGKERVQLVFSHFQLLAPPVPHIECDSADALVVLAPHDGRLEKLDAFCGAALPRPLMSSGARLVLELRAFFAPPGGADGLGPDVATGFQAHYSFIENLGVSSGHQLPDLPCAFAFNASDATSGTFQSPNFPGLYPRDTECHYFFHGRPGEHVRITFHYFDVEGVEPCEALTASDYVEFSNFMARDRKYARYCGQLKELQVESDRKFFRVTFRTNDRLDATGFNASYAFEAAQQQTSPPPTPARASAVTTTSATGVHTLFVLAAALLDGLMKIQRPNVIS